MSINPLASVAADFERFTSLISDATRDMIPDSGDRSSHVQDLAAAIVRLDPVLFGTVSALLSTGDHEGAGRAAQNGLAEFEGTFPWLTYPADPYKRAARMAWRKHLPGDVLSADGTAARANITDSRRDVAALVEQHQGQAGWTVEELERDGEALRKVDLANAEAAEKTRVAKIAADRRAREAETRRQLGFSGNDFLKGVASN